jgi:oxygen-independent coproporphyrinogen III oxidase
MARLSERFRLLPDAEIAIESDPRALADVMIQQIGLLGFNRASFGVQEFDPNVQAAINRIQPPEMVERATWGLRAAGVPNINFDLIYGLPHQTAAALCRTVEQCVAMEPDRIALFGYAHVPWVAKNQRMIEDGSLPTPLRARRSSPSRSRDAGSARLRPGRHRPFCATWRQSRHCCGRGTPASQLSRLHQ